MRCGTNLRIRCWIVQLYQLYICGMNLNADLHILLWSDQDGQHCRFFTSEQRAAASLSHLLAQQISAFMGCIPMREALLSNTIRPAAK